MKASDSCECRNCHSFKGMPKEARTATAWRRHKDAQKKRDLHDCHKGFAHHEPKGMKKEEE
ncbi:MAG: NapC/NirT family cytochrome c [Sulfuricella sp.]